MTAGKRWRRGAILSAAASLALAIAGCGSIPGARSGPVREGGVRPGSEPPALRTSPHYETASAAVDVAVPVAAFSRWFAQEGAAAFGSFLGGIATVPGVTRTEPVTGAWRAPGDRRRLVFADGTTATEQILTADPRTLRTELWDLTSGIGRYVAYAIESVTLSEAPSGTRVAWTVAFAPVFQPPDG